MSGQLLRLTVIAEIWENNGAPKCLCEQLDCPVCDQRARKAKSLGNHVSKQRKPNGGWTDMSAWGLYEAEKQEKERKALKGVGIPLTPLAEIVPSYQYFKRRKR